MDSFVYDSSSSRATLHPQSILRDASCLSLIIKTKITPICIPQIMVLHSV